MPTISINQLTFAYPDQAENLFAGLTVNLDTSWKLALVGRNGRGKTTLLKIIAGCLLQRARCLRALG
ncbi:ATP-binding cassette domain-containing protein [Lactobacillus porci]|uniref:ATP-binding cassette domain-containing protein n=1 Tax=Lactobacillus porci TaxID=2012477 RepID=A0A6A8MGT9_9LACO|nr:ATP-binding cassette domain-containing protein [Lactobacillus porci]